MEARWRRINLTLKMWRFENAILRTCKVIYLVGKLWKKLGYTIEIYFHWLFNVYTNNLYQIDISTSYVTKSTSFFILIAYNYDKYLFGHLYEIIYSTEPIFNTIEMTSWFRHSCKTMEKLCENFANIILRRLKFYDRAVGII